MKRCDPNAKARCPDGNYCELYADYSDGSWCDTFNEIALKQSMTNADRIRAMSDEELCEFLMRDDVCDQKMSPDCSDCEKCVLDWLRQPAEVPADD